MSDDPSGTIVFVGFCVVSFACMMTLCVVAGAITFVQCVNEVDNLRTRRRGWNRLFQQASTDTQQESANVVVDETGTENQALTKNKPLIQ